MDHATALRDLAALEPPARLDAALRWIEVAGGERVDPADRAGLHPLVIPLGRQADGAVLGLLRWPTPHEGMAAPVVRQHDRDPARRGSLERVAVSVDTWLHGVLAQADVEGRAVDADLQALVDAAGPLYTPGAVAASGRPLDVYRLLHLGTDHALLEAMAEQHLARGDAMAAQITADRACRGSESWARPQGFRALLLERLGHHDEARDAAVAAIADPAWTLHHPFAAISRIAGWSEATSIGFRRLADTPGKLPADRAAHLLDACAVEGGDWDGIRAPVAALYREAGLEAVARLVAG